MEKEIMENIKKFEGLDYIDRFASKISVMHQIVRDVLAEFVAEGDKIIDIGGGPGMGARIIDGLGIRATVMNIEPSSSIENIPQLSFVRYIPVRMTFKQALDNRMPCNILLMVSSAHEIALCNEAAVRNKQIFFSDLMSFAQKYLNSGGFVIIGFPNYREGATEDQINRQRRLTESILGHSHPPDELFRVEEFIQCFGQHPEVSISRPMDITGGQADTVIMANVAVFRLKKN